jgi:roadblock/LC7 domain-containing protein
MRHTPDALGSLGWHPTLTVGQLLEDHPKGAHMAALQELLDLEGVVVAGEFDFEGRMLDYEAKMDMSEDMAQTAAQFCAAVSVMLNTMASSFADRSGMNWVPQHGWAYSGGEWTACIGDGGRRGVFVETSKADFNRLFEALGEDR